MNCLIVSMKLKYKYIVAAYMAMLILFTSIGFNIVETLCDVCNVVSTSITIAEEEKSDECLCCTESTADSCCTNDMSHQADHHHSTTFYAKLDVDSLKAKSQKVNLSAPVIALFVCHLLPEFISEFSIDKIDLFQFLTADTGRAVLARICILRI